MLVQPKDWLGMFPTIMRLSLISFCFTQHSIHHEKWKHKHRFLLLWLLFCLIEIMSQINCGADLHGIHFQLQNIFQLIFIRFVVFFFFFNSLWLWHFSCLFSVNRFIYFNVLLSKYIDFSSDWNQRIECIEERKRILF